MKIGLFFGSFNPIHNGHLIVAQAVLSHAHLDQVWFVISPKNPLKSSNSLLHEFDRLDLVEAAIWDNPKFKTCDIEFRMPKPNFTINTLVALDEKFPKHKFSLLIGQDNLKQFTRWKNHKSILENYDLLVYPRPRIEESPLDKHPKVRIIKAPLLDISATYLRDQIRKGKSIKYLVPENVEEVIHRKKYFI